jgi:hypothetical protein
MMKIAVFGCGPAGLMAAHGAVQACDAMSSAEDTLVIFSRKVKSDLYGAQYLHKPIPFLPKVAKTTINYKMVGEMSDYRRKVYGSMWPGAVSPEDLEGTHEGWDIRATYASLWSRYEGAIHDVDLDPVGVMELLDGSDFDIVFNSVPLDRLCYQEHNFGEVAIWAAGDAPDRGIDVGRLYQSTEDTVTCNAEPAPGWYRKSRIFGHTTVEWPSSIPRVPVSSAAVVRKPTSTDCKCWPTVTNVGRYGRWEKGVLSHTAYDDAYMATEEWMMVHR